MSITFHPEHSAPTHSVVECLVCHASVRIDSALDAEALCLAVADRSTRVPGCRGLTHCPTQALVSTGSDDLAMPFLTLPTPAAQGLIRALGYSMAAGRAGVDAMDFAGHVLIAEALGDLVFPGGSPVGLAAAPHRAGHLGGVERGR